MLCLFVCAQGSFLKQTSQERNTCVIITINEDNIKKTTHWVNQVVTVPRGRSTELSSATPGGGGHF
jgi:hypothetical protein